MAAEYLENVRVALEGNDAETFWALYRNHEKRGILVCVDAVLTGVNEEVEFLQAVEDAANFEGLKEVLEDIWDELDVNLLEDEEGRLPDLECITVKELRQGLVRRFDTDDFKTVKTLIKEEFLMPLIRERLGEGFLKECAPQPPAKAALEAAGWLEPEEPDVPEIDWKLLLDEEKEQARKRLAALLEEMDLRSSEECIDDAADMAALVNDTAGQKAQIRRLEKELVEIDAALARLAAGTYGICEKTGKRIPAARLKIEPAARTAL